MRESAREDPLEPLDRGAQDPDDFLGRFAADPSGEPGHADAVLEAAGVISEQVALVAVMAVFSTNALTKCALAFYGARTFGVQVGAGLLLGTAATWGVFLLG